MNEKQDQRAARFIKLKIEEITSLDWEILPINQRKCSYFGGGICYAVGLEGVELPTNRALLCTTKEHTHCPYYKTDTPEWWAEYQEELKSTSGLPRKRVICPLCNKLIKMYDEIFGGLTTALCEECAKKVDQ